MPFALYFCQMKVLPIALWFSALACLGACTTVPQYPAAPSISFGDVYFKEGSPSDVIVLTIQFKDGDGNLGLDNSDILNPPFQELNQDSTPNRNRFNIFPVLYRKSGDQYDSISDGYRGIFPRLREGSNAGPIEGIITYELRSLNFFQEDSSIA
jgi:hypothetical protein